MLTYITNRVMLVFALYVISLAINYIFGIDFVGSECNNKIKKEGRNMNWISVEDRLPTAKECQTNSDFLCKIIYPCGGGKKENGYIVLHYLALAKEWETEDMIVTDWCVIEE